MFSADVLLVEHDFPPKNGPVPSQPVNGYEIGEARNPKVKIRDLGFEIGLKAGAMD
jgi:hypothetical protein